MALASQSVSPVSRRHNYRRRKRRSGRLLVLLAAIALTSAWFFWPDGAEEGAASESEAGATVATEPAPGPTDTNGGMTANRTPDATRDNRAALDTNPRTTPATTTTPQEVATFAPSQSDDTLEGLTTTPVSTVSEPEPSTPTPAEPEPTEPGSGSGYKAPIPESFRAPSTGAAAAARLASAKGMIESDPFRARAILSDLIASGDLEGEDRVAARDSLNTLGEMLFFNSMRSPDDAFTSQYVIQNGDSLERIAKRDGINVEWGMLQTMNGISNPSRIRIDQRLKIPVGTFHAVVSKTEYVMDLFLENESGRVIIASYPVGLGELNGTPTGRFKVRSRSKLKNPPWTNPRTGERFYPDDPKNPIGERWIGLEGIDPANESLTGYGIHGTIDMDSIGDDRSMGCIRLRDADVIRVYDALVTNGSTITINP